MGKEGGCYKKEKTGKGKRGNAGKEPKMDYAQLRESKEIKQPRRHFICLIIFIYLLLTNKQKRQMVRTE